MNGYLLSVAPIPARDAEIPKAYEALLTEREQNIIQKAVKKRRAEYCAGRYAAKQAAAQLLGIPAEAFEIDRDCFGAPFFRQGTLGVSISHSDDWALAAVYKKQEWLMAVDLQRIDVECCKLKQHFLTVEECALLDCMGCTAQMATLFWSAREAVLKLLGGGFYYAEAVHISEVSETDGVWKVSFQEISALTVLARERSGYLVAVAMPTRNIAKFQPDDIPTFQL